MTDMQLINFCDKHCKTAKALFAWDRVNRMIALAGNPKGYEPIIGGSFQVMRGEMQTLVDLARKRKALPKVGLHIDAGKAYRDVNGEVRYVIQIVPRFEGLAVVWDSTPGEARYWDKDSIQARKDRAHGFMRMREFKEWALEEVIS